MATRHEAYPGVAYAGVHAAGGLEGGKATLEAQAFEFMRKGFVKKVFGGCRVRCRAQGRRRSSAALIVVARACARRRCAAIAARPVPSNPCPLQPPGILAAQLLLTAVIAAPIVLHGPTRAFVSTNPWVVTLSSFAALGLVLVLSFSESARHRCVFNLPLGGVSCLPRLLAAGCRLLASCPVAAQPSRAGRSSRQQVRMLTPPLPAPRPAATPPT